jgi:small subunit ribosomal protein S6
MPAQNPTYDLMLLLDTASPEEQRTKVLGEAERILTSNGATITSQHDWGTRRTAFEIRHKKDAEYHLLQFEGGPEVPAALDRYLRITDGVVRFRVIKLKAGTPTEVPDLRQAVSEAAPVEQPAEAAPAERL